jgi:hypothetical protein
MDETVTAVWRLAVLLAAGACAPLAHGQSMGDPTQPPPALEKSTPGGPAISAAPAEPQLQSVLIVDNGRRVAVIDGVALRVGDMINGAKLIKIMETEVVLLNGKQQQVYKLAPPAAPAPAVAPATTPASTTDASKRPRGEN